MTTSWHSYTKIHELGHKGLEKLLQDPVLIEEKVDGSQFSFGVFTDMGDPSGKVLLARSKGTMLNFDAPEALFIEALETVKKVGPSLQLGWTYRAEYLRTPKHHTLAYGRIPKDHLIIFDISPSQEAYLTYDQKKAEADRIGLECVPKIYEGMVTDEAMFRTMLDRESILGNVKVEGVVVKNYSQFGRDDKVLIGKFVSSDFKEIQGPEWREQNPKAGDIIQKLIQRYKAPARWSKAAQHLEEKGQLTGSVKDIGPLILEAQADLRAECLEEIADILLNWALPNVLRGSVSGIAEWYKAELLAKQFETKDADPT